VAHPANVRFAVPPVDEGHEDWTVHSVVVRTNNETQQSG
jgi:hypothetical protein